MAEERTPRRQGHHACSFLGWATRPGTAERLFSGRPVARVRRARCRSAAAQRVQTPWRLGHAQIRHRTRRSRCCHTMPNLKTIRLPCASRSRPAKHVRTYQDEFVHRSNAHTSQMIGAGTHARPHRSWLNRTDPVAPEARSQWTMWWNVPLCAMWKCGREWHALSKSHT